MAMNQITDNIYVGSLLSVSAVETLKNKNVTHILSALSKDLAPTLNTNFFKQLVIDIDDVEEENIMKYFNTTNAFIDEAVQNGESVLVHCQAGISRSVTIACAYIMKTQKLTASEVIDFVRSKRPVANPNDSFATQLDIYYQCGYEVNTSRAPYRQWLLVNEAEKAALTGSAPEEITYASALPTPESAPLPSKPKTDEDNFPTKQKTLVTELKCKRCRTTLANSGSFILHKPKEKEVWHRSGASVVVGGGDKVSSQCMHYFLEPVLWMKPELDQGKLDGKLLCPKCNCRVGSYKWQGLPCSCGTWVTPAIELQRSKVDEQPVSRRLKPNSSGL